MNNKLIVKKIKKALKNKYKSINLHEPIIDINDINLVKFDINLD